MSEELTLLNFQIPSNLKTTFYEICRFRNVSMTSQLNILIKEHVNKEIFTIKCEEWIEETKNEPIDFLSSNYQDFYGEG